jgi:hypothetical protein
MKFWDLQEDFGRCGITAPKILCLNFVEYKERFPQTQKASTVFGAGVNVFA